MKAVRALTGTLGELLITLGVLTLLFVGWQLWWTDVAANAVQSDTVGSLSEDFQRPGAVSPAVDKLKDVPLGEAFAIVRIPALGRDYAAPVVEGTTRDVLRKGIGHYDGTAMPGQVGNFAIAGHRMTYGGPFRDIERVLPGDRVIVETAATYYVYRVGPHTLVPPSHVAAIAAMPERPGVRPDKPYITLTACHPKYAAQQRWIVHGELERAIPRSQGLPAGYLDLAGDR